MLVIYAFRPLKFNHESKINIICFRDITWARSQYINYSDLQYILSKILLEIYDISVIHRSFFVRFHLLIYIYTSTDN